MQKRSANLARWTVAVRRKAVSEGGIPGRKLAQVRVTLRLPPSRVDPAHGGDHRIRGCDAPAGLAAELAKRLGWQFMVIEA